MYAVEHAPQRLQLLLHSGFLSDQVHEGHLVLRRAICCAVVCGGPGGYHGGVVDAIHRKAHCYPIRLFEK